MSLDKDGDVLKEIGDATNEKKMLNYKTSLAKNQFINEIKNGLGDEIKKGGNKFKVIKPSIWQKIKIIMNKIFTGF